MGLTLPVNFAVTLDMGSIKDLLMLALNLVGIVVGVLLVLWQLNRQHKSSLKLQRENAKEELKVSIYKLLIEKIRYAKHACMKPGNFAVTLIVKLDIYLTIVKSGQNPPLPSERAESFLDIHHKALDATTDLVNECETWSIAFPGGDVFKTAFNVASHDAMETFIPLYQALLAVLPVGQSDVPPSSPQYDFYKQRIVNADINKIRELATKYREAIYDMGAYILDFEVEAQNNLLSQLFENRKVAPRKPLDSSFKVISTEPEQAQELMQFFEQDTAWGKAKNKAEENFRATQTEKQS